jgi:hypothetical protein
MAVMLLLGTQWTPAAPQRGRQASLGGRSLETVTRDLSDKGIEMLGAARQRGADFPPELYFVLGGFSGKALALAQLAADRRDENALREGARSLIEDSKNIDSYISRSSGVRFEWRLLQDQVVALSDYFGLGYNPPRRGRGAMDRGGETGRFRWQGRVDGRDLIVLRGDRVNIRHIANNPITEESYDFKEPLPRQEVNVRLTKLSGRGTIEIREQPSARNGYAVTVSIDDSEGGTDLYRFTLDW